MPEIIEQLPGKMGWVPDEPDSRDWKLAPVSGPPMALPPTVDLRPLCPPVYDQSSLGSCAANGPGALFRFVDMKQGGLNINPSRLFIYYEARRIRGWESIDSGAVIRDAMKALADLGAAPEETWPYDIARFTEKPPAPAYAQGLAHQTLAYLRVDQKLDSMRGCLAQGYPFVIGATLYDNFMAGGSTGMIPMPAGGKAGGHCFMVVGYRDSDRRFICQNSWGVRNHDAGFFYIPYDYLTNDDLAADAWTIRSVEDVFPKPEPEPIPEPEPPPDPNYHQFTATVLKATTGKLWLDPAISLPNLKGRLVRGVGFQGKVKRNDEDVMVLKGTFDVALKDAVVQCETV